MTFSSFLQRQTIIIIMMVMNLKVIPLMVVIVVAIRIVTTAVRHWYYCGVKKSSATHVPIIVDWMLSPTVTVNTVQRKTAMFAEPPAAVPMVNLRRALYSFRLSDLRSNFFIWMSLSLYVSRGDINIRDRVTGSATEREGRRERERER